MFDLNKVDILQLRQFVRYSTLRYHLGPPSALLTIPEAESTARDTYDPESDLTLSTVLHACRALREPDQRYVWLLRNIQLVKDVFKEWNSESKIQFILHKPLAR